MTQILGFLAYVILARRVGDAVSNEYHVAAVALSTQEVDPASRQLITTWGDVRLLGQVLRHAAQSSHISFPSWYQVKAHHPSDRLDIHGVIQDYTLSWVSAMLKYYQAGAAAGASVGLLLQIWPDLRNALNWFAARVQPDTSLLLAREFVYFDNPYAYDTMQGATLNAFYYRALLDASSLGTALGFQADAASWSLQASAVSSAMNARLWNASAGTFNAGLTPDGSSAFPPTQFAAFIPLALGLLDGDTMADRRAACLAWMAANDPINSGIGAPFAAVWQLASWFDYGGSAAADNLALDIIRTRFPGVLLPDTDTTTELFYTGDMVHNMYVRRQGS